MIEGHELHTGSGNELFVKQIKPLTLEVWQANPSMWSANMLTLVKQALG